MPVIQALKRDGGRKIMSLRPAWVTRPDSVSKKSHMPYVMAQTYNPSYFRDGNWEDQDLRFAWTKSYQDSISTNKKVECGDLCPSFQVCRRH
jgi:dTDP-4-dehydrorhamnose 3,5-epimerase-like enzyme